MSCIMLMEELYCKHVSKFTDGSLRFSTVLLVFL